MHVRLIAGLVERRVRLLVIHRYRLEHLHGSAVLIHRDIGAHHRLEVALAGVVIGDLCLNLRLEASLI